MPQATVSPTADLTAQVRDALSAVGCVARVRRLRSSVRVCLQDAADGILAAGALAQIGRLYWNRPTEGFLHITAAQ